MMNIKTRLATKKDIQSLVELMNQLFEMEFGVIIDVEAQKRGLELLIDNVNSMVAVAEFENKIVGMCTFQTMISTSLGGLSGWIEDMVIDKNARGKGIGKMILDFVKKEAIKKNYKRIQLLCDKNNTVAQKFYADNGFESYPWCCWTLSL